MQVIELSICGQGCHTIRWADTAESADHTGGCVPHGWLSVFISTVSVFMTHQSVYGVTGAGPKGTAHIPTPLGELTY